MSIGDNIKKYRKLINYTQKDLATSAGCSEVSIRKYESNDRKPSADILNKIAITLGVPIAFLIDEPKIDNHYLAKKNTHKSVINQIITNEDFCMTLNIDLNEASNIINTKSVLSIESLKSVCKYLKLTEYEEAFLYSMYMYKTDNDIFRVIAFYYYLTDNYSVNLNNPADYFLSTGENVIKKFNLSLKLGFALGYSNSKLVAEIIHNESYDTPNYKDIIQKIFQIDNSYNFPLDSLSFESRYKLFIKLAETLKYELYKIYIDDKSIEANFYESYDHKD